MSKKKEYMVHIWGGAWNHDADPSVEKDLGIKDGYYYFDTEEEKNNFCKKLNNPIYLKQGIMMSEKYGIMTHKRTIYIGTFEYKGKEFTVHYDFGYEYPEDKAIFIFNSDNYSCDCNRSLFIRREYGDVIPELNCGYNIKLRYFYFEYWD